MDRHFVGIANLSDLLDSHKPGEPLYAVVLEQTVAASRAMGVQGREYILVVTDIEDSVARYWRFRVGYSQWVGNTELSKGATEEAFDRGESLLECIEHLATEQGISIIRGTVAMPKDYVYLYGRTNKVRFVKDENKYILAENVDGATGSV
jgi:hypothetical protein